MIAVIAALRILPKVKPQPTEALDYAGLALMATGLPLLTYGLAEIGSTGSITAFKVLVPLIIGIALVATFAVYALHVKRPLLNLRLYARPTFSSASIAMFFIGAALFGGMILLPLYWQTIRHMDVVVTGLLTAPQGLGAAMVMPLAGRLTDRFGGGPLALFGVALTTVATIPFALIGAHTPIAVLCVAMMFRGIGIGFAFMPAMSAAFASLKRSELSDATPQLNVLQRVGGSIGIAVLAVVLQRGLTGAHTLSAAASAYGTAFLWAAGLTALAIIPCIVLHPGRARAPRRPGRSRRGARGSDGGGDGGMSPSPPDRAGSTTSRARARRSSAGRSRAPWARCAGCVGARTAPTVSSPTPSTGCCSALLTTRRWRRASWHAWRTCRRPPRRGCSTDSRAPASSHGCAPRPTAGWS